MAYSTISKPGLHFNTKLYNGTGSSNAVTGVGFQPDFTWIKRRNSATNHHLHNAISGATKVLYSNSTGAESTDAQKLSSFDSDGFTVGTNGDANNSSGTFVSWNWKANGAGSANTDGSINSTVSVNTTAGFSIVSYTGNGSSTATVGHGLGVTPAMIIIKNRTEATSWCVTHKSLTTDKVLRLEGTNAEGDIGDGELDSPPNNSSTFGFNNGTSGTPLKVVNESSDNYIAYCFAEKKGYSKFGSYTGNGDADGTFVYTGMRPAFVMVKQTNTTRNWLMFDNKRNEFNDVDKFIKANTSDAEGTTTLVDFTSNGFKCRTTDTGVNESGGSYIYLAFAENPFVANDSGPAVPVVAR
jgi:hypothetical protein